MIAYAPHFRYTFYHCTAAINVSGGTGISMTRRDFDIYHNINTIPQPVGQFEPRAYVCADEITDEIPLYRKTIEDSHIGSGPS